MTMARGRWQALLLVLAISCGLSGAALAAATPQKETISPEELKKFESQSYTPPEIREINDAEERKDYQSARRLEDALIDRPLNSFPTKWAGQWIKSLALHLRFQDRQMLGDSHKDVLPDLLQAARYGNLRAIRQSEDILEEYLFGMNHAEYPPLTDDDILSVYRIGAELADSPSAVAFGSGRTMLLHAPLPEDMALNERIFWMVLGLVSDKRSAKTQRDGVVDDAVQRFGPDLVEQGLVDFGIVGGKVASTLDGLPGRDFHAAFAAESDLRAEYSIAFGSVMPPPDAPQPEMNARELFDDISVINGVSGMGRLFLLVPSVVVDQTKYIRTFPRETIMANLLPDDTVIVRCGPLSHVAVLYKVNSSSDELWFSDPLYEYWQPSHNACMSNYRLVDGPDNGFLVIVSLKEVMATLQGVITRRADLLQ
jgi:hypothetical protein